jgi:hypothetical protein
MVTVFHEMPIGALALLRNIYVGSLVFRQLDVQFSVFIYQELRVPAKFNGC